MFASMITIYNTCHDYHSENSQFWGHLQLWKIVCCWSAYTTCQLQRTLLIKHEEWYQSRYSYFKINTKFSSSCWNKIKFELIFFSFLEQALAVGCYQRPRWSHCPTCGRTNQPVKAYRSKTKENTTIIYSSSQIWTVNIIGRLYFNNKSHPTQ